MMNGPALSDRQFGIQPEYQGNAQKQLEEPSTTGEKGTPTGGWCHAVMGTDD